MLLLLPVLVFGQFDTIDYKVLKSDVVNSQNYQFPSKFVDKIVPAFSKKPIYLLDTVDGKTSETLVGEVACIHHGSDKWLVAKAKFDKPIPKNYVMRAIFKITECNITSGCNFTVESGEIKRFVLLSPIFASDFK